MMILRMAEDSRLYIFYSKTISVERPDLGRKSDALVALPGDIADAHRPYDGLPILIKFAWRENLYQRALRCVLHEHGIGEVVAKHA